MPLFFTGRDEQAPIGRVVACPDVHAIGSFRFLDIAATGRITFETHKAIITGVGVSHQSSQQFLHTLGNHVYIYVFGDRIGTITVNGLAFAASCNDPGNVYHGFESMVRWYAANRVSNRAAPVVISIGRTPIEAFLVDFNAGNVDPKTRTMAWTMTFRTLPGRANAEESS